MGLDFGNTPDKLTYLTRKRLYLTILDSPHSEGVMKTCTEIFILPVNNGHQGHSLPSDSPVESLGTEFFLFRFKQPKEPLLLCLDPSIDPQDNISPLPLDVPAAAHPQGPSFELPPQFQEPTLELSTMSSNPLHPAVTAMHVFLQLRLGFFLLE